MYVLDTLLNSFRSVLIKFVMISVNFQSCISRLNFQAFGLVKLSLILWFRLTAICGFVAGDFGAVWVFGHLGRFFFRYLVISWIFLTCKSVFASFCSVLENSFIHFPVC